jgi:hypothetical protein
MRPAGHDLGMDTDGPVLGELREVDASELDWLAELDGDAVLGYAPLGWPAETWVLHGMWEDPAAAAAEPRSVEQRWRDEHPGQRESESWPTSRRPSAHRLCRGGGGCAGASSPTGSALL